MKKKGKDKETTVSFLLDRTGSMQSIKNDVIGGFNQFISEQKAQPGKCRFILTLFDTESIDTADFPSIADVPNLTNETYQPRAETPLLDAIGKTIRATEAAKPKGRVLFVVFTDGEENSSHEFKLDTVKALVAEKTLGNWDFVFMGADIDAYADAGRIGVGAGQTVSTNAANVGASMAAMSDSTSAYRQSDPHYMAALKAEEKKQRKTKAKAPAKRGW